MFGLWPRFSPVAWGILIAFVAVYLFGSIAEFPSWLLDLVPFTHTQHVSGEPFRAASVVWLLLIDAALIGCGLGGIPAPGSAVGRQSDDALRATSCATPRSMSPARSSTSAAVS